MTSPSDEALNVVQQDHTNKTTSDENVPTSLFDVALSLREAPNGIGMHI
jgi:hypothetical protein